MPGFNAMLALTTTEGGNECNKFVLLSAGKYVIVNIFFRDKHFFKLCFLFDKRDKLDLRSTKTMLKHFFRSKIVKSLFTWHRETKKNFSGSDLRRTPAIITSTHSPSHQAQNR